MVKEERNFTSTIPYKGIKTRAQISLGKVHHFNSRTEIDDTAWTN